MNQLTPAPLPGVELAAAADVAKAAPAQIALPVLYSITIFLSAGLVFSIQPIVAKMVLPLLGGAPAVWTTCMLFFQGMLLAGYVYAHLISRRWTPRAQCGAHLALLLLGGLMLPLGVANPTLPGLVGQANPAAWLLKYLLASAGLPFFVLSASAPLLQQWFSNTRHPSASDPYFLYSASNLGSLLALLSYPILVEPTLRIATQSQLWSTGYAVLVLLLLFCAATHWGAGCAAQPEAERKRQPKEADFLQAEISRSLQSAVGNPLSRPTDTLSPSDGERDGVRGLASSWKQFCIGKSVDFASESAISTRQRLRWIALAFVPSSLMLGVTTYLTTDIASIPLLWILPLSLYLVTFILAFAGKTFIPKGILPNGSWVRIRSSVIGRLPPHSSPLPPGEGMQQPSSGQTTDSGVADAQRSILPLPEGKGRGEGERGIFLSSTLIASRALSIGAISLAYLILSESTEPVWLLVVLHLCFFFVAALVCHSRLADERPAPSRLTEFYLWLSVGGVLGGLFNAVLAPNLFNSVLEYPMAIALACWIGPNVRRAGHASARTADSGPERSGWDKFRRSLVGSRVLPHPGPLPLGEGGDENSSNKCTHCTPEPTPAPLPGGDRTMVGRNAAPLLGGVRGGSLYGQTVVLPAGLGLLTAALAIWVPSFEAVPVQFRLALVFGLPLLALYTLVDRPARFGLGLLAVLLGGSLYSGGHGRTLHVERNFFGVLRVTLDPGGGFRRLVHGNTVHGRQFIDPARRSEPLSYYHRSGPLGQIFKVFESQPASTNVAVVGLGAGSMASYAKPHEAWTYYEINPAVVSIAQDANYFTFLSDSRAGQVRMMVGDARLRLREASDASYGLILLDAFSSDAIPVHLITREAIELYLSKLAAGGLLAFHISNRCLELEPILGDLAGSARTLCLSHDEVEPSPEESAAGKDQSHWVVLARRVQDLGRLVKDGRWVPVAPRAKPQVWTDDFSNIWSVFKWR